MAGCFPVGLAGALFLPTLWKPHPAVAADGAFHEFPPAGGRCGCGVLEKSRIHRPLALQPCEGVILLDQFRYFVLQLCHPRLGMDGFFPAAPQLGHHGLEEKLSIVPELVEEGEEGLMDFTLIKNTCGATRLIISMSRTYPRRSLYLHSVCENARHTDHKILLCLTEKNLPLYGMLSAFFGQTLVAGRPQKHHME